MKLLIDTYFVAIITGLIGRSMIFQMDFSITPKIQYAVANTDRLVLRYCNVLFGLYTAAIGTLWVNAFRHAHERKNNAMAKHIWWFCNKERGRMKPFVTTQCGCYTMRNKESRI